MSIYSLDQFGKYNEENAFKIIISKSRWHRSLAENCCKFISHPAMAFFPGKNGKKRIRKCGLQFVRSQKGCSPTPPMSIQGEGKINKQFYTTASVHVLQYFIISMFSIGQRAILQKLLRNQLPSAPILSYPLPLKMLRLLFSLCISAVEKKKYF